MCQAHHNIAHLAYILCIVVAVAAVTATFQGFYVRLQVTKQFSYAERNQTASLGQRIAGSDFSQHTPG